MTEPGQRPNAPVTYRDAGVDIDAGNALVEAIKPLAKATRRLGADADLGGFGALFDVRSTAEASDLAYTSLPLDPHTDNPYRDPVPGVQLLHCLVNETSGGHSTLVDGLAAARALESRDPEAFA